MNVFGIGTGELLLILLIVLLVVGPERLPQLARQWGKFIRVLNRFTRTWHEISTEINRQINLEEMASASPKPKPGPPPPASELDPSENTIAPPDKQQQAAPQLDGDLLPETPLPAMAVETPAVGEDLTPGEAQPTRLEEPDHE